MAFIYKFVGNACSAIRNTYVSFFGHMRTLKWKPKEVGVVENKAEIQNCHALSEAGPKTKNKWKAKRETKRQAKPPLFLILLTMGCLVHEGRMTISTKELDCGMRDSGWNLYHCNQAKPPLFLVLLTMGCLAHEGHVHNNQNQRIELWNERLWVKFVSLSDMLIWWQSPVLLGILLSLDGN